MDRLLLSSHRQKLLVLIFILLSLGIGILGYVYYQAQLKQRLNEEKEEILSVSDFKIRGITNWRNERLGDAHLIYDNAIIIDHIQEYFSQPSNINLKNQILQWMDSYLKNYSYKSILLIDKEKKVRLYKGYKSEQFGEFSKEKINRVLETKEIYLSDLYTTEYYPEIHQSIYIPLCITKNNIQECIGVLILRTDPKDHLFPLIQSWPVPSDSAETLLVKREGDSVIILNRLRHSKDTVLSLRLLLDKDLPSTKAVQGIQGFYQGIDYRGIPVISYLRPVPGTDWYIVSKMDLSEIYSPLQKLAYQIFGIVCLLILICGVLMIFIWRSQNAEFYKKLYESEIARTSLEKRYEYFMKYANDIILLLDTDGKIIEANEQALETYGYTKDELLKLKIFDLRKYPDSTPSVKDIFMKLEEKDGYIFETEHKRKDGTTLEVEVSTNRIDIEGKIYYQGIIRDITKRKKTDELLQLMGKMAKVGGWEFDVKTGKGTWTEEVARIHELDPRDETNVEIGLSYYIDKSRQLIENAVQEAVKLGKPYDLELEMITPTGQHKWIRTIGQPEIEDDKVVKVKGSFQDITEIKQSESELLKLSQAVEQSANAIVITDLNGNIEYVNSKFSDVTGYSREEVIGKNPKILKSGELSQEVYRELWETIRAGKEWSGEFHNRKKNGELFWEYALISPIKDSNGKTTHYLGIKEDITLRKNLESQLLHSQKMEVVGTLAGGVAHDFNNLLTIIIGYSEMLLGRKDLDGEMRESLGDIHTAAERASSLTKQLLLFSRKAQPQFQPCDLHLILDETEKMLKRTLGPSIDIVIQKKAEISSFIGDSSQIQQIIMNMAINARDAMPRGGKLIFQTDTISLDEEYCKNYTYAIPGDFLTLTIIDTGQGMNEETQKHIFDPFFTTKDIGKGTGLGLSVVYGIVKNHGGWINVYSVKNEGTTFRIYFPFGKEVKDTLRPQPESEITRGGNETILLVDDDPMVLSLGKSVLENLGYHVIPAEGGLQGYKLYQENKENIHLVLTDLLMPEMDGRTLIKELRNINPTVKIILASGADLSHNGKNQLMENVDGFILKPYRISEMGNKVRIVLDSPK